MDFQDLWERIFETRRDFCMIFKNMNFEAILKRLGGRVGGCGGGCEEGKGGDLPFQVFSSLRCPTRPAPCKHGAADLQASPLPPTPFRDWRYPD